MKFEFCEFKPLWKISFKNALPFSVIRIKLQNQKKYLTSILGGIFLDLFSDLDYSNFVYSTVLYHTYGPALVLKSFHPNVCIIVKAPFLHSWDLFCSRAVMILHSTASTLVLERSTIHVQSATQYICLS